MTAPIDPIPPPIDPPPQPAKSPIDPATAAKPPFQIRGIAPWLGSTLVVLFVLALLRTCAPLRNVLLPSREPSISHSIVVQQVEAVSKLVTSEVTLRDVVTYEDTWMRSTKRSVVLVTGKVLVGFNLQSANVDIDHATKRITVKLPRARVLAIDIMKLETFDERRGLWNPFTPTDRDAIYSVARAQLQKAVMEMNAVPHANESAKQMLERLLSTDGYTVEVEFSAPSPLEKRATG